MTFGYRIRLPLVVRSASTSQAVLTAFLRKWHNYLTGNCTINVLPLPTVLSTVTVPP